MGVWREGRLVFDRVCVSGSQPITPPSSQGGPGCSSMLGAFYINGPTISTQGGTVLTPNTVGTWTRAGGVLYVDQPAGTGFSTPADGDAASIPSSVEASSADLYAALAALVGEGGGLGVAAGRPLIIAGESYAGKFVPAFCAYALAVEASAASADGTLWPASPAAAAFARSRAGRAAASRVRPDVRHRRPLTITAAAVGNGLVDPGRQVLTHADVLADGGLLDADQRAAATRAAWRVAALTRVRAWSAAHAARAALLADLTSSAGLGTMLDVRRYDDYDGGKDVPALLNRPRVRSALGVAPDAPPFSTCSDAVLTAFDEDVMQDVTPVYSALLASGLPMLLYEGAADAQDGPASAALWQARLTWPGRANYTAAKRQLWRVEVEGKERIAGYWRTGGDLTTVTLRNAGHMAPHDQPVVALAMLREWLRGVLGEGQGGESA